MIKSLNHYMLINLILANASTETQLSNMFYESMKNAQSNLDDIVCVILFFIQEITAK